MFRAVCSAAAICVEPERAIAREIVNEGGFTLIETLVALLLLALAVPVLLESQLALTRTERTVRAAETVVREIDRVLVESLCGPAATNMTEGGSFACSIERFPAEMFEMLSLRNGGRSIDEGVPEPAMLVRWKIVPEDRPSLQVVMFTRHAPE